MYPSGNDQHFDQAYLLEMESEKVRLYFSTGEVVGGTVTGAAVACLAKYRDDNRKRSERMGKTRNVYDPRKDIRRGIAPVSYNSGDPERL